MEANAAGKETTAEHEEHVGEDRAEHAGLNDSDFAVFERHYTDLDSALACWVLKAVTDKTDDQLDRIAERGIEQSP